MKTIAITIDEDMLKRIDSLAGQKGQSRLNRSKFIRDAINDHLNRLEKEAQEEPEREIFKRNREKLHRMALALTKEQAEL